MLGARETCDGCAFDKVIGQFEADRYRLLYAFSYGEDRPADLAWSGCEGGWEMRRKLKAWCSKHGVAEYKIVRNTSYVQDLHVDVYELCSSVTKNCTET